MFERTPQHDSSLNDVLLGYTKSLYDAECQLLEGLPVLGDATSNHRLKVYLRCSFRDGMGRILRLEPVLWVLGERPRASGSPVVSTLEKEASRRLDGIQNGAGDVIIISEYERLHSIVMVLRRVAVSLCHLLHRKDVANLLAPTGDLDRIELVGLLDASSMR